MPIVEERVGDALEATQDVLLVPVPGEGLEVPDESFAARVMHAIPRVRERYEQHPMSLGEMALVGDELDWEWRYRVGLVAVSLDGPYGWNGAAASMYQGLTALGSHSRREGLMRGVGGYSYKIASQGVPGEGHRYVNGRDVSELIRQVFEISPHAITIYHRGEADVREPRRAAAEPPQDSVALGTPASLPEMANVEPALLAGHF
jgi:hypothetical protein